MRRIIVILLTFCYLVTTNGVVAVSHYCMDRLASVSFLEPSQEKCPKCGMQKKDNGCCNDKEELLKMDTNHYKAPVLVMSFYPEPQAIRSFNDFLLQPSQYANLLKVEVLHPPPLLFGNYIYLENRVFRI